MELATRYLGLDLRNPLVASASPLSKTVDGVRRLVDAGVAAVVLYSLFEEQVRREAEENTRLAAAGTDSFAESLSYFPDAADDGPWAAPVPEPARTGGRGGLGSRDRQHQRQHAGTVGPAMPGRCRIAALRQSN